MILFLRSFIALGLMLTFSQRSQGQSGHADIEFWYDAGQIVTQTNNGLNVGTGDFATSGLFQQFESNPGFTSEADVGQGIGGNDIIAYNVLDHLQYWNGASFAATGEGVQLRIENNLGSDTIVNDISGPQPGSTQSPYANFIDQAGGGGDFHGHIDFFLEPLDGPTPSFGAYGLKLSLSTSAVGVADSDPFFIVFNFGLDNSAFTSAVDAFAESLQAPAQPGDFNGDGQVNLADYSVWRDHLGADENSGVLSGNGDGDSVTATDYELWKMHFGTGSASSIVTSTVAVPEPSTLWVLALGSTGLCFLTRRKRKGSRCIEKYPPAPR